MTDRLTNTRYKSNPVPAVNAAATKLVAGWKVAISSATCTMEKRTLGDYATTLNIALWRSGQIDMMLQSTRWQFGKHSSRSASLHLDPGKSKAPAYQGRESLWQVGERGVITFQPTASLLTDFANSREMRLSVEDFSLSETYDISGAALALAELRNCTARHAKA